MTSMRTISRRWRDESGVTVLLALFVLTLTTLILGAVYQAVTNDTQGTRLNLDQSRAFAAAQAGIAQYTYQLNQNPNYWQSCKSSGQVAVPNSTDSGSTEYYSYQPIAATTAPLNDQQCDTNNPTGTMIEGIQSAQPATFRIESTGTSNNVSRSIVAEYKQPSFLSFVYYTDYEASDPVTLGSPAPTDCAVHYSPAANPHRPADCGSPISFVGGDSINGPMHSEDYLAIGCPTGAQGPIFGRAGYDDPVEAPGTYSTCSGSTYTVNNSAKALNTTAPSLTPPTTNGTLLTLASSGGYVYTGRTTIVLSGNSMSVTTATAGQSNTGPAVSWPANGVIYVKTASTGCPVTYSPSTANNDYPPADNNCGNVYVKGNYTQGLTIASDNDVIINGNVTTTTTTGVNGAPPTGGQLLGLVANDFVRVYHPCTGGTNGAGYMTNPYIYAAILAVNHSFIVDNYSCGAQMGTLNVYGVIAQLYRGPVGTSGGGGTGYLKNYVYDDRLAYSEPPYFLNPTSTAWYVARDTECDTYC